MVKDNLDVKRGNPLSPLHGLIFLDSSKGSFIYTITQQDLSYTSCGALAGMGSLMGPLDSTVRLNTGEASF